MDVPRRMSMRPALRTAEANHYLAPRSISAQPSHTCLYIRTSLLPQPLPTPQPVHQHTTLSLVASWHRPTGLEHVRNTCPYMRHSELG